MELKRRKKIKKRRKRRKRKRRRRRRKRKRRKKRRRKRMIKKTRKRQSKKQKRGCNLKRIRLNVTFQLRGRWKASRSQILMHQPLLQKDVLLILHLFPEKNLIQNFIHPNL
jgi:hypothetical protein